MDEAFVCSAQRASLLKQASIFVYNRLTIRIAAASDS
jgi:hypothetical protein